MVIINYMRKCSYCTACRMSCFMTTENIYTHIKAQGGYHMSANSGGFSDVLWVIVILFFWFTVFPRFFNNELVFFSNKKCKIHCF